MGGGGAALGTSPPLLAARPPPPPPPPARGLPVNCLKRAGAEAGRGGAGQARWRAARVGIGVLAARRGGEGAPAPGRSVREVVGPRFAWKGI